MAIRILLTTLPIAKRIEVLYNLLFLGLALYHGGGGGGRVGNGVINKILALLL